MSLRQLIFAVGALGAGTSTVTDNFLPLAVGAYVMADVPCKGAASTDTMSYWGKDGSLNSAHIICRLRKVSWVGNAYTVDQVCTEILSGDTLADQINLSIPNATSFRLGGLNYRYCGKKIEK